MTITEQLDRLAKFSSTEANREGVTRLPFTPAQEGAARWLAERMEGVGLTPRVDPCGTVAGFLPGRREEVLILGSHYDSVPRGGRYDGCAGILTALEAVRRLRESGELPQYSLMVLALNDEEGVRFTESFLSSRTACGDWGPEEWAAIHDRETGESLADLMAASPFQGEVIRLPEKAKGYLEFHVEQGPVLDKQGLSAAVVDRIVGLYHCCYRLRGAQNHAGTTPMDGRTDPMPVFGEIAARLPELSQAIPGSVATVGWVEVAPNAPNVIPGSVEFSVDLRSADPEGLEVLRNRTDALVREMAARAGIGVDRRAEVRAAPVAMDPAMGGLLERCMVRAGLPVFHMDSGAGHDAQIFAQKLPAAMIFAPSRGGLSHCREEFTREEDLQLACDILLGFIQEEF